MHPIHESTDSAQQEYVHKSETTSLQQLWKERDRDSHVKPAQYNVQECRSSAATASKSTTKFMAAMDHSPPNAQLLIHLLNVVRPDPGPLSTPHPHPVEHPRAREIRLPDLGHGVQRIPHCG